MDLPNKQYWGAGWGESWDVLWLDCHHWFLLTWPNALPRYVRAVGYL